MPPTPNPKLLKVPLYVPGRSNDEIREELGLDSLVKMSSNENPRGTSPLAQEAILAQLSRIHTYPGLLERNLRRALARAEVQRARGLKDTGAATLDEHNFIIGNGAADVMRMIGQTYVYGGGNVVMSQVTFPLYHIVTTMFGAEARRTPPQADLSHDLDAMLDQVDGDTRMLVLCSPNNPTGQALSMDSVERVAIRLPEQVLLVVDEAYHGYVTDPQAVDAVPLIARGLNLVSLRSFSKFAGLANMRIGYAVGPRELIEPVQHARMPFHVGDLACAGALASLADQPRLAAWATELAQQRDLLCAELQELGLRPISSQANFVLIPELPRPAAEVEQALLHGGYIVRGMAPFGCPGAIRISLGRPEDNRGVVKALAELL